MKRDFDQILDECLDRMNSGQSPEECIKLYPGFAQELEPLLRVANELRSQSTFKPSLTAKARGRERLSLAIAELERKRQKSRLPLFQRLLGQPRVWTPVAAALMIAAIGYGLWSAFTPTPIPTPTPMVYTGILEVRVTDAPAYNVSAINVTVGGIEAYKAGDEEETNSQESTDETGWLTVIEEERTFDLKKLSGVEEVLGSNKLDAGYYTQIRMDVKDVTVTIDGRSQDAVLPSGKLKLIGLFEIERDEMTVLTMDFDAARSVKVTGGGKVIFRPAVKVMVRKETAAHTLPSPVQSALGSGDGGKFVRPIPELPCDAFQGATEIEAVEVAVKWVAQNYSYVEDVGDVWAPSDEMYKSLRGDCEDWAILLTSLLRFHTQGGIPADRVWVAINVITKPGAGVTAGHAWVGYKPQRGGMIHIEPGSPTLYHRAPRGMLNFNDSWVEGGGRYIKAGD